MGEPVFNSSVGGRFFGQSSFARHSIVSGRSVVNVKKLGVTRQDLKILAPLGCGLQTGSGTVTNVARAGESDQIAIAGMGGVGLASVIAAKSRKCKVIIGIDRVESRLVLAQSLGATHTINTTGREMSEVVALLKEMTGGPGPTLGIDTTAFPPLVAALVEASRYMGKIIQVGTGMPNATLSIHLQTFMVSGKQYFGAVQGHAKTEDYIPQMVGWWKKGLFPVEKLVKHFDYTEFAQAVHAMESGDTIKPIIIW